MLEKRKPGRPPTPKDRARIHPLQIRLTRDEHRTLVAITKAAEVSMSEWVRDLIRAALGRRWPSP